MTITLIWCSQKLIPILSTYTPCIALFSTSSYLVDSKKHQISGQKQFTYLLWNLWYLLHWFAHLQSHMNLMALLHLHIYILNKPIDDCPFQLRIPKGKIEHLRVIIKNSLSPLKPHLVEQRQCWAHFQPISFF